MRGILALPGYPDHLWRLNAPIRFRRLSSGKGAETPGSLQAALYESFYPANVGLAQEVIVR